ncbi:MAG: hypothetical protein EXS37_02235 [Opitutus sp.]|nr:hypothetical protein [Opitutus sp.]
MKYLRIALVAFASALGVAFAQDEEKRAPPVEIPDFSNLDEYIYEPKSTMTFGFRYLKGAKLSFSGQGKVPSPETPGAASGPSLLRTYHNGGVRPDARVVARLDGSGNPVIDPQTNSAVFDSIAPDGRSNTWNYSDANQLNANGFVRFDSYSADVIDTNVRKKDGPSSAGMDISMSRDMGKLRGRFPWTITAGMSINDIAGNTNEKVRATINTLSDYYSLFGQTPPTAPYSSPSSSTSNVLDASGNALINDDGSSSTITTDTSVLIGNEPAGRTTISATDDTSVSNRWKLKGAYYTFRAGPTLWIPFTSRLRASISAGAAVVYSGSNYTVTQTFQPALGAEISDTSTNAAYKILPGYYADATVQFDLTERAGFYAGAVMQSAGSYSQNIDTPNSHYSTKIDLANQSGVRAGLSIRF